jgi:tetratricopeptide (TPR) repeat protein
MSDHEYDDYPQEDVQVLVSRYEEMVKKDQTVFLDQSNFEQIIDFYEDNNLLKEALEAAEMAIMQHPFSAFIMTKKAQVLFDLNNYEDALDLLSKAEIYDPADVTIYLLRSDIFAWLSKYPEAIEELDSAAEYADKEEIDELFLEYADVYEDWAKYDMAFIYLRKAIYANPKNNEALSRMNMCADLAQKQDAAIRIYKRVIDEDPYSGMAWNYLGNAYLALDLYEKAVNAYEFAQVIDEGHGAAFKGCGDALAKLCEWERAIENYSVALDLVAPKDKTHLAIGDCHLHLGDFNKARQSYRQALKLRPENDQANFKIGESYSQQSKWQNAIKFYENAVEQNNGNDKYHSSLAHAYFECHEFEDAAIAWQCAIDINNYQLEYWLGLAACHHHEGDTATALEIVRSAAGNLFMESGLEYYLCGYLYALGKKKEALIELEKGLTLNYDLHPILFDKFPDLEQDAQISSIILHYKTLA